MTTGQTTGHPPGPSPDKPPDSEIVDIMEAAQRLGITYDGVRRRLKRGKLDGYLHDGKWRVILPAQAAGHHRTNGRTTAGPPPDAAPDTVPDSLIELVAHLRQENEFLRRQVERRRSRFRRWCNNGRSCRLAPLPPVRERENHRRTTTGQCRHAGRGGASGGGRDGIPSQAARVEAAG
jgi:hypothetical protein